MRNDPTVYMEHGENCFHNKVENPYNPINQEFAYSNFELGFAKAKRNSEKKN